jgi:Fe-S-cluster-containing hydrogenase component 2
VRSTARSVANQEFHRSGEILNEAAHRITRALEDRGYRALNPSATFPMEMDRFPGRIWVVAHKPVAVAAGLGVMGIHRNVIHPRFGNFILLGTILVDTDISAYGQPLDYSPCLECKLCVAACPVGAIGKDGQFDFMACSTHNYREFMGGFTDWVQTVADSSDGEDFRSRVTDAENASMWQSLSFKPNYKAAYCIAVCPAGEDVIEPYLDDRKEFMDRVLKPLQDKRETLYVLPNSAAKAYAEKRFPHKPLRIVNSGIEGRG